MAKKAPLPPHKSRVQREYENRFGAALNALAAQRKQDLIDMGFDLNYVVKRDPRKHTIALKPAPGTKPPYPMEYFVQHLITLAEDLGLQGRRITAVKLDLKFRTVVLSYQLKPKTRRKAAMRK